jgi:hypothetical protein
LVELPADQHLDTPKSGVRVLGDLCPCAALLRICTLPAAIYVFYRPLLVSPEAKRPGAFWNLYDREKLGPKGAAAIPGPLLLPESLENPQLRHSYSESNAVEVIDLSFLYLFLSRHRELPYRYLQWSGFSGGPKHLRILWFPMGAYRHWQEAGDDTSTLEEYQDVFATGLTRFSITQFQRAMRNATIASIGVV